MKRIFIRISIGIVIGLGIIILSRHENFFPRSIIKPTMKITSPAFGNNQLIPSRYACDGNNTSPPLVFSDVPRTAKSFVLIIDDPDAPSGTWVHWVVFNIPASVREIKENSVPQGVQGMTSVGKPGYGGPCPPSGTHRYFFKLYALDATLSLTGAADKKTVEAAMQTHILAHAELIGLYSKKF
jgi:Raf kinase inhibitor-like YbhB/YbcL family protein